MTDRIKLALKGFLMGTADVIPGVSGGTMALIVGIYQKLVHCIGSIGLSLVTALFKGAFWRQYLAFLTGRTSFRAPQDIGTATPEEKLTRDAEISAFLSVLGIGIVLAVLTMVRIIPGLLNQYPAYTSAFFFGLVLASAVIPFRLIKARANIHFIVLTAVAIATFVLMGLNNSDAGMGRGQIQLSYGQEAEAPLVLNRSTTVFTTSDSSAHKKLLVFVRPTSSLAIAPGEEKTVEVVATRAGLDTNLEAARITVLNGYEGGHLSLKQPAPLTGGEDTALWFIFLAGAIAICAMILPGISGSFLLLMLGQYGFVMSKVYTLVYLRDSSVLPVVLIFMAGIALGILAFSRVLNLALTRAHDITMAALTGLMLGSLRKLWPFQDELLPAHIDSGVAITALCFVVGMAIIIIMGRLAAIEPETGDLSKAESN
jgi:uncharacterized membrane protein